MDRKRRCVLPLAAALAAVAAVLAIAGLLGPPPPVARANPGVLCVAPGGTGCASPCEGTCYAAVQEAVDAAVLGDEIRVAGAHSGVQARNGLTQVVYLSQTLTIRGGYTTSNWTVPYPLTQPTTLDAQGQGRVLYITGEVSPTVAGLVLTGGSAVGLGGSFSGNDAGGGVLVDQAGAVISGCTIVDNAVGPASTSGSGSGGGVCFVQSAGQLVGNVIVSNTARWGGGVRGDVADFTMSGNQVLSNTGYYGGGVYLTSGSPLVEENEVRGNEARYGGGLALVGCPGTVAGNRLRANSGWFRGGGVYVSTGLPATIEGNLIAGNDTNYRGGGLYIERNDAILTNNVIVDNVLNTSFYEGPGVWIGAASPVFLHTTIAGNTGHDGSGVYVTDLAGQPSTVYLTNTILVSQTVGITVATGSTNTAVLNGVLWHGNGTDYGGPGTISVTGEISGAPAFAPDGYHLAGGSAALGQGGAAGVVSDIDGEPRPASGPDLGADELNCLARLNDGPVYTSLEAAIEANSAATDVVRVAGTCFEHDLVLTRSLALRGGWSGDFASYDPALYPTTIDAQGLGRVVHVAGPVTVTLESLRLTNGATDEYYGGGVYVEEANVAISGCHVYSNTAAGSGGGIYYEGSGAVSIVANQVYSNAADWQGGGLYVQNDSGAVMVQNDLFWNEAGNGGGVHLSGEGFSLSENRIFENEALKGGGIFLEIDTENTRVERNQVYSNTSEWSGGGFYGDYVYTLTLTGNTFSGNTAGADSEGEMDWDGGGLCLEHGQDVTLTNNLVVDNRLAGAGDVGVGLYVAATEGRLLHNTVARNIGGQGQGIYLTSGSGVGLTNTILVSHMVGVEVDASANVVLDHTLWGAGAWANESDVELSGGSVVTVSDVYGDPAFVDPASGDYHIAASSAALDAGVEAGVTEDIDGGLRPILYEPDLGADEWAGSGCLARLNEGQVYTSTQAAIDAASSPGDLVKVAGTCYEHDVVISKTLTLQGGWDGDFTTHDPQAYTSTLDAQGQGRVLVIIADDTLPYYEVAPMVEYLHITHGDAAGSSGGGIWVGRYTSSTLRHNVVYSNSAGNDGGGLYLDWNSLVLVEDCAVFSNTADSGGGVTIDGNSHSSSRFTLLGNAIYGNRASDFYGDGGGISIADSTSTDVRLERNLIRANVASRHGGGLEAGFCNSFDCHQFLLLNNVFVGNTCAGQASNGQGAGVWLSERYGGYVLAHNTFAGNHGGDGSAVRLFATAWMTNNILVSHTVGISTGTGGEAVLEGTLWFGNQLDAGGAGSISTGTVDLHQDPQFADPVAGDYRLDPASPGVDAGLGLFWLRDDREGAPRPDCVRWDIGAYEVQGLPCNRIYLPSMLRDS